LKKFSFNPLRQRDDGPTAVESSPISEKFPPTNAPRTLYTVKKKIEKFSKLRLF
jgi:hypothetical protein